MSEGTASHGDASNVVINIEKFARDIDSARRRIAPLLEPTTSAPPETTPPATEIALMLEELNVAEEEMRQQADELIMTRDQLEQEHLRYLELFEDAPDAYIITDEAGVVREANHAAERLLQIDRLRLRGKPLAALVDEEFRRAFRLMLDLRCGAPENIEFDTTIRPRDGEPINVAVRIRRAKGPRNAELRWIIRDVTPQRRAEAELRQINAALEARVAERTVALSDANASLQTLIEQERESRTIAERANRAKSEFLAVLSHEFRTPLQGIYGYAELFDSGIHGPLSVEQHEDMKRIRQGLGHLVGLVNQLLDRANIDVGHVVLDIADVSLERALRLTDALVLPQCHAKAIRYWRDGVDPTVAVRGDLERLQQVLINIVGNAVKYTNPGGAIEITCNVSASEVAIEVTDTGCGIPENMLESVFEPYVRLRASGNTPAAAGTGLGLAISRDLVRLMGGTLIARSRIGAGSTFVVTLPRATDLPGRGSYNAGSV
ncbi:MAG: ATP-binding protein [Gemmatimonadaceae bacterium]